MSPTVRSPHLPSGLIGKNGISSLNLHFVSEEFDHFPVYFPARFGSLHFYTGLWYRLQVQITDPLLCPGLSLGPDKPGVHLMCPYVLHFYIITISSFL